MEPLTLAAALVAAASSIVAIWQRAHAGKSERALFLAALATERDRIDHLLGLLARRDAPAEEAWYMADQLPIPVFPENAEWDESGLYYNIVEPETE